MDDAIRTFADTLGRKALARDWSGVHQLLAPWMQSTVDVDGVRAFFEDEYRHTLAESEIHEMHYPAHPEPEIGGNTFMSATELRKPITWAQNKVRLVAPEVTDENMRYWLKLQLQCSEEQMDTLGFDFLAEVWAAVVETPEGLRVGYWSQGAY
jgi:hypothetical protein